MILDELLPLIQTTPWFSSLGRAARQHSLTPITDLDQWQQFNRARTSAEFGLPHDEAVFEKYPYNQMSWLPTSHEQPDPIHGNSLADEAKAQGREAEFRAARMEAFKVAATSQRGAPDQPILKVGGSDLNEAARSAGCVSHGGL